MNRKFYDELNSWKNSKNGVPLMVVGARQVGKTHIINKFCQENYKNYYYLNFMKEKKFVKLLKEIETFERRIEAQESLVGSSIRNDNDTVLFVDEVYESKEFLVATKNARFIFSEIDKNDNRKREYVTTLDCLMASNLVLSCNLVVKPEYPLKGFINI